MYIPEHFAEPRADELARIIHAHPLGMLVTHGTDGLDADHIPFAFDPAAGPHGTLTAHVARSNPVWQRSAGAAVMVVFRGAEGYISPNWYPSKHEAHRQVPTWNYEVVHAHGTLTVRDDERFVRGVVGRLTRRHEAAEPRPWKMSNSEPGFIDGRLQHIVGIEIAVTSLVGKRKLSQNKEARDRAGAAEGAAGQGNTSLAERMGSAGADGDAP
ncbi:FMN-binding negative transcriptional regulator [Paracidovorax wautersii]|uniref:FMN-binding negative transcriptional regulator n=1 Tax=Paracidovorax wautersii TaxID=1177982 RepID=UPI0031CECC6D